MFAALTHSGQQDSVGELGNTTRLVRELAQWLAAVLSMKGESDAMPVESAVAMIRATSPAKRSEFASEIWARRKAHSSY